MSDDNPHAAGRTALDLALQQPWLTDRETLETVLAIAGRWSEGPEAVAQKLGRPLMNTRGDVMVRDGVAVISVTGPIFRRANLFTEVSGATSIETLATDFRAAMDDPQITGIVLDIDSPGGSASGISEFSQQVFDARGEKPVTAYVGNLGASAALWIASAAETLVINETASLGSLGVVAGFRLDADPSRIEIISSQSPRKRPDPTTPEGRADIQTLVDDLAQVFVETVARNRGVDVETVLSDFGQGGMLVGKKAVEAGMADRLGSLENVIAGLSGSTSRGSNMTMKHPSPDITREVLAEHYPAIAQAFREEGIDQATATLGKDLEAAVAAARAEGAAEGAKSERERIQSIEAAALPGHGELIASLKFDGVTTGAEAALKIVAAEREQIAKRGNDLNADRGGAFVPAGSEEGADDATAGVDSLPVEERCKAKWDGDPNLRAEFGGEFSRFLAFERNKPQVRLHRPAA